MLYTVWSKQTIKSLERWGTIIIIVKLKYYIIIILVTDKDALKLLPSTHMHAHTCTHMYAHTHTHTCMRGWIYCVSSQLTVWSAIDLDKH